MSFGFSASDVIALAQLARNTYKAWKTVCGDHANITGDLAALQALMAKVGIEA